MEVLSLNDTVLTNAGIPPGDCQALHSALDRFEMLRIRPRHTEPHVVCAGIYNAGKSTLLNALTRTDSFPTGDIPTTKEVAQLAQDGFIYVDTPGLNAQGADDAVAEKALREADIILFAACVQNGGLSQAEAEWLSDLRRNFGQRLQGRLIFAITKCGQVEDAGVEKVAAKFAEDFQHVLGFTPERIFRTDAVIWADGRTANEPLLLQAGGIDPLREYVLQRCGDIQKSLERDAQADLNEARATMHTLVQQLTERCRKKMESLPRPVDPAEIENLVKNAETKIAAERKPYVSLAGTYISAARGTTSFEAWGTFGDWSVLDKGQKALRRYASSCISEANDGIRKIEESAEKYTSQDMDSIYFKICESVNSTLEELYSKIRQNGIQLQKMDEVTIEGFNSSIYESMSSARCDAQISSPDEFADNFCNYLEPMECRAGHYKKGLFKEKYVVESKYTLETWNAMYELKCGVERKLRWYSERVTSLVTKFAERNANRICNQADDRIRTVRTAVRQYFSSQSQNARKPYQAAIDYLASLEKELK